MFQWIAYLLIGLAIGRLALSTAVVPVLLLAGGTVVAVLAKWLGIVMMEDWGGRQALQAQSADPAYPLDSLLQVNLAGIEQSGSWWWLATAAPHSGTTLDLLHTSGVAAAVIGACLLLGRLGQWVELDLLLPLRGAGAMTLSLYTAHLCAMAALHGQPLPAGWTVEGVYWAQAAAVVVIGTAFAALRWRGPLEWLAHAANQARPLPAGPPPLSRGQAAGSRRVRQRVRLPGPWRGRAVRRRASRRGRACGRRRRRRRS